MFKYNAEVDNWSHKMIEGIEGVWGYKLEKTDKKNKLITMDMLIKYLDDYIGQYGKEILNRFNNLTGLSFNLDNLGLYVNTTSVSMHNGQQVYVSIGLNHSFISYPTIVIHEIFHIYFSHYIHTERFLISNDVLKTEDIISPQEENDIKEIITVIINGLFKDIIDTPDSGYPDHKEMRDEIATLWKNDKKKDFNNWLNSVIKLNKKMATD